MKKKSLKELHNKAWKEFSEYIRKKDNGICYTCGIKKDWKEQNAGHFRHGKLDFDEMNVHCQCVGCNKWKNGNLGFYAVHLIKFYGQDKVDDLILRSNQVKKYSREELEEIIKTYSERNKILEE